MSLFFRETAGVERRGTFIPQEYLPSFTDRPGIRVDADSALRHDAVWSCRTRISQDVSMMPVDVVRYVAGERQPVEPVAQIIAAPSAHISAMDWRYQVIDSWLGYGNAWGLVTATTANGAYPTRIELVNHREITIRDDRGRARFFLNGEEHFRWPVGDLWHVPAYVIAGSVVGLSPIQYHAVTIGHGLNAQQFSADFFADGGHPTALIQPEGNITADQSRKLKERFLDITRGNREPVVLPSTTKYTQLQVSPDDSQFLDAMRYSAEQICRIYGEDPADHGVSVTGSSLTYANRSDADLARFKRRQFWVTKLQNALTDLLPRPQVVRLNVSATLMMTARERHEIHKLRLESETTTVNEVRRIEDEKPFPDARFDQPGIPGVVPKP